MIVYIGPTIKGVVYHNQIFNYNPAGIMTKAAEVCESSRRLFVNIENIVQSRYDVRITGSVLNVAYKDTLKQIRKES